MRKTSNILRTIFGPIHAYFTRSKISTVLKRHTKTEMVFLLIGLISTIILIANLFTSFGDYDIDVSQTASTTLNDQGFFDAVEHITMSPFNTGDSIQILSNGDQFFPDLLQEINTASSSITITNFIWDDTTIGNKVFDALTVKAAQGVKVRALLDGVGSVHVSNEKVDALRAAGGKVEFFRPLGIDRITRLHRRTHVRAITIDGKTSYFGGMAFSDAWLGNGDTPDVWRDLMFKVHGEMSRSIQDQFSILWRETTGELLDGPDFYTSSTQSFIHKSPTATTTPLFTSMLHIPSPDFSQGLTQLIWLSISSAKKHIYIETPYLLPDKNILSAMKKKAAEGVDIEIIIPGKYIDEKNVKMVTESYYRDFINAGIHLYEYQPSQLHAKIITTDDMWSVVGSANLDSRSRVLNVENVMGIYDTKFAQQLENEFNKDKANSREVTQEVVNKEPWYIYPISFVSQFFIKQY